MSDVVLRRSGFVHLVDLGPNRMLAVHAITQMRLTVTHPVARLIRFFDQPHPLEIVLSQLASELESDAGTIRTCAAMLLDRGILTDRSHDEETADIAASFADTNGRDPTALLDQYRRAHMEGAHPYWSVQAPHALHDAQRLHRRVDVLLLGDCDIQMESDFLRQEAARRGLDLRAAASFAGDTGLAGERTHDAILIGALQARHAIVAGNPGHHGGDPALVYVEAAEVMLKKLRR